MKDFFHQILTTSNFNLLKIIAAGTILRFLAYSYSDKIDNVVPFEVPQHLSHHHLKDCVFLESTIGLKDMYDVGSNMRHSCHAMPILVYIFGKHDLPFWLYVFIDATLAIVAFILAQDIVRRPNAQEKKTMNDIKECNSRISAENSWIIDVTSFDESNPRPIIVWEKVPLIIALISYCNPFSIIANTSKSLQTLLCLAFTIGLLAARKGHISVAALCIAIGTYLEIYPFTYLFPIALIVVDLKTESLHRRQVVLKLFSLFLMSWCVLMIVSYFLCGKHWSFLVSTYGWMFTFQDMTPNVGVNWYLFITIFSTFRSYFVVLFGGLPFIYFIPLAIRLHSQPTALITIQSMFWALTKPHPSCDEILLHMAYFMLSPQGIIRMRSVSLISLLSLAVPLSLIFVDYKLWMTGNGNANYIYFMSLTTMVFLFTILMDFVEANVKHVKATSLTIRGIQKQHIQND